MTLQERKSDLMDWLQQVNDEQVLNEVEAIRSGTIAMSEAQVEAMKARVAQSRKDISAGNTISLTDFIAKQA